jgi:hypothetical protein
MNFKFNLCYLFLYLFGIGIWIIFFYLNQPIHDLIYFDFPMKYHYGNDGDFKNLTAIGFNFFDNNFSFFDNHKEFAYLQIIKDSFELKIIPFYIDNIESYFPFENNFFFAAPIWTSSPQIIFLKFLNVYDFYFMNVLLMFSISFYGLLLIRRKYQLSFLTFLFLFFIFNFNGHIISYLSVYGQAQLGYFLLPHFFYYFLSIYEIPKFNNKIQSSLFLGLILWLILLQGSLHLYVQLIFFITIVLLFNIKLYKYFFISLITAFLLSVHRILPAFLLNSSSANYRNVSGFWDLGQFTNALTELKAPYEYFNFEGWHEYNYYISINALIVIIIFALFVYLMPKKESFYKLNLYKVLPIFIFTIFCFRNIYEIIPRYTPLFNIESLTARFFIIPLILITIISSINIEKYFTLFEDKSFKKIVRTVFSLNLVIIIISILNHLRVWRLQRLNYESVILEKTGETIKINFLNSEKLDFYSQAVIYSTLFSIIMFIIFILLIFKLKISLKNKQ